MRWYNLRLGPDFALRTLKGCPYGLQSIAVEQIARDALRTSAPCAPSRYILHNGMAGTFSADYATVFIRPRS